jgi:hypothetical protein
MGRSTLLAWSTTDPAIQRINLFEPIGVSKLRFGVTPAHPLATLRARNGSMIEASTPAQPSGTTTVGVVFSPNGAEEDYLGPLNYTYYDEVTLHSVVPAGLPIIGGTNLTLAGDGFDQATHVLTDERLRCLFDAGDGPYVLPQATPVTFRNGTHVVCAAPPSWLGRPPWLMHGAPVRLVNRTVALRLALNGVDGSSSSVSLQYYAHANISRVLPASGPLHGGTLVAIYGHGLAVYASPWGRALCRFGDTSSELFVVNDTTALCTSPNANVAVHAAHGALVDVQIALNGVDYGTARPQTASFEYYAPPVLRSVWPLGAAAMGGTIVTLHGSGLLHQHITPPPIGAPDAPKCLFGHVAHVGWVANSSAHGSTLPAPDESNATKWAFLTSWTAV